MIYYFQFDNDGYITDMTRYNPNDASYTALELNEEIPSMVMRGYYKWNNGFVLDEAKQAIVDEQYNNMPVTPFG